MNFIPVTIRITYGIMPPETFLPYFFRGHKLELIVGSQIDPRDFLSVEALTDHLRKVILSEEKMT